MNIFVCAEVTGSLGVIFACNFRDQFSDCVNECCLHGSHVLSLIDELCATAVCREPCLCVTEKESNSPRPG